jgi:predicted anti-sigma-YlaC factor YlaD
MPAHGDHDLGTMGGHLADGLDDEARRAFERHLASCPRCRAERASLAALEQALRDVPPEAVLDGPFDGSDLVVQRTLREVRVEAARRGRRRWASAAVAAAVVILAAVAGGFLLGRAGDQAPPAASAPVPDATPVLPPAGTRVASTTDDVTGARATVRVEPAAGWVRVHAAVAGIPAGQRCRLWVVARDGTRELAGSWLVSEAGARDGTSLDGTALVAPDDVVAVEVDNVDGEQFVTVEI